MRPIREIVIHCSATPPDWKSGDSLFEKRAEIRRWHVQGNGWSDIGYHYLIDRDGHCAMGRPLARIGAHVRGHNTGTIGLCLIGGHGASADDAFEDHFTPAQDRALRALIAELQARFGHLEVTGHNLYAPKACPGFRVGPWLRQGTPSRPPFIGLLSRLLRSLKP
ncbi:Phage lysin, N-acetylmuramoyl-L-alanine amidase [Rhodovulum sp. P5]|uniref:amidase n=1 Tax=Rhodovulum phage vB_RhkS_P1 TaxID=1873452 RepID=UPI00080A9ECE|nr:N-acetylmuramoyl-L-alanine amidase [Rhodovulum sp. P5]YP_009285908.1 amidase [Rhodovulum phage vB_RhkS_P1]ANT39893.1 N-acetylmuramoyl-L-alanine amidase [Rhodovulum phage vB_RhkS_P1]ARE38964.1 Phage lysin, N-acetylmuramoyl-L-alanine amidase [Rhodovulum sp. P5]